MRRQLWESQQLTQWLVFSREEGTGLLALVIVTGSVNGQCYSPFPKGQERQPLLHFQFHLTSQLTHCPASLPFLHHQLALFFLLHPSPTYPPDAGPWCCLGATWCVPKVLFLVVSWSSSVIMLSNLGVTICDPRQGYLSSINQLKAKQKKEVIQCGRTRKRSIKPRKSFWS